MILPDLTDSYKPSHFKLYPKEMTGASAYIEARGSSKYKHICFFGLQAYIKEYLMGPFDYNNLGFYELMWNKHGLPFNREGWEEIRKLGYLPLEIQAVPEGYMVPKDNVLIQIQNTRPGFEWLPGYLETTLVQQWYPNIVSTRDKKTKMMIRKYLEETGCENIESVLAFMVHDFGFRACTCPAQAMIGGAAHLIHFQGTDTYPAIGWINKYYNNGEPVMWGYSIAAMEHSTVFTWDNEDDAYENALIQYLGVGKTVACVLDTNDFDAALERFAVKFKDRIAASGGRVVIRHDSGSPIYNSIKAIERMMELFGYTVNKKGFRVLPDYIRFIWGDGTDPQIIDDVLYALVGMGIAAENIVFGEGAGLLQKVCRDDIGFSFKLNEKAEEAVRTAVCKRPVTGLWKASKAGRLALIVEDWKYKTIPEAELNGRDNILRTVFKDGKLLIDENFSVIRERANENFEMEI